MIKKTIFKIIEMILINNFFVQNFIHILDFYKTINISSDICFTTLDLLLHADYSFKIDNNPGNTFIGTSYLGINT